MATQWGSAHKSSNEEYWSNSTEESVRKSIANDLDRYTLIKREVGATEEVPTTPTVPGLYAPDNSGGRRRMLVLDTEGKWSWLDFTDASTKENANAAAYKNITLIWAYPDRY